MNDEPIIVFGAGPAGLTAAHILTKAGRKVIVLEKEPVVGGISASQYWEGFIVEYGPHTYHVKNDRIDEIIREHYGGELPNKKRCTRMLIRGKYINYPLKFWQLIKGMNPFFSLKMLGDFLYTTLKYRLFPRPDDSFQTWGIKRFGKTLYKLCFGQYTERVWGISPSRLSVRLASQKLHRLNLKDILIKLVGGKGQEQATYWQDFIYPEEGMGVVFENMKTRIEERGGEVWLKSRPIGLTLRDGAVVAVKVEREGVEVEVPCSAVISAVPISTLIGLLGPYLDNDAVESGRKLSSRSLVLVNLIINVPIVSDAHWIYLLDPFFRFNRFCEQKNLLTVKKPRLQTMLTFEVCCDYGDELWGMGNDKLKELALRDISRIDIIDGSRATDCIVKRVKEAYPIYDLDFETRLRKVFNPLSEIGNLYSTGRQGLFLNTDMHDSMEMGLLAAEKVLGGVESAEWYEEIAPYLDFKTGGTNR